MRYRLDAQHYIHDRLLEPGHIIGDGTDVPFTDRRGQPMRPSRSMTPLDGDAKAAFQKAFPGAELPNADALAAIPIHEHDGRVIQPHGGVVETVDNVPGGYVIGPDGQPTNELKKGLPDSGSPNHPVGQPVIGTQSAPGTTPSVPPRTVDDHGQPPGAPLRTTAVDQGQAQPNAQQARPQPTPTNPSDKKK